MIHNSKKLIKVEEHKNILEFSGLLSLFFLIIYFLSSLNLFLYGALFFLALGLFFRKFLLPVYVIWMHWALLIGRINNWIILSIIYYCVLTPLSIVRRAKGSDPLLIKKHSLKSYWIQKDTTYKEKYFERQF